jgi:hypothetical protein
MDQRLDFAEPPLGFQPLRPALHLTQAFDIGGDPRQPVNCGLVDLLQVQRNKNAAESRRTNENVPYVFALRRARDHCITPPKGTRMLQDTLALMPLWAFAGAIGVTLFAGFVKGATGFAMPLIMISGLSLFIDPLIAVAGIILPIVMSNALQAFRFGPSQVGGVVREYWRYILIVCVTIVIVAQFIMVVPTHVFYLILGVPVVILSLIQLFGVRFHIPKAGGVWRNGVWASLRAGSAA